MASKKEKQSRKKFIIKLCVFLGVLTLAYGLGLYIFSEYLKDYELSLAYNTADTVAYPFLSRDLDKMYELTGEPQKNDVDKTVYLSVLDDHIKDPVTVIEVKPLTQGTKRYVVMGDSTKFAAYTLKETNEKTAFGFKKWAFDSANMYLTVDREDYTIKTVPGAKVYVNDLLLSETENTTKSTESVENWLGTDESITRDFLTYQTSVYGAPPTFGLKVTDSAGNICKVEDLGDNSYVAIPNNYDTSLEESIIKASKKLTQNYTQFMMGKLEVKKMLDLVHEGTDLYETVKGYDTSVVDAVEQYEFSDFEIKNIDMLTDNAYSCDITVKLKAVTDSNTIEDKVVSYKIYVVRENGKVLLHNIKPSDEFMQNIGSSLDFRGYPTGGVEGIKSILNSNPQITSVDLRGQSIPVTEIETLQAQYPQVNFIFSLTIAGVKTDTEAEEISFKGKSDITPNDLETALTYLKKLKKVDMTDIKLDNEKMAEFRDQHPNVEIVWTIWFGKYKINTDITAFSTLLGGKNQLGYTSKTFDPIRYCTKLKALDLGHNHVTDISFIKDLDLKILILACNKITDISPLQNMENLEYVELFSNGIRDFSPLAGKEHLIDLNINRNKVKDTAPFYQMPALERLWIGSCGVSKEELKNIQAVIPNCEINTSAGEAPTTAGWREHPRYFIMYDIFHTRVYRSFDEEK